MLYKKKKIDFKVVHLFIKHSQYLLSAVQTLAAPHKYVFKIETVNRSVCK